MLNPRKNWKEKDQIRVMYKKPRVLTTKKHETYMKKCLTLIMKFK